MPSPEAVIASCLCRLACCLLKLPCLSCQLAGCLRKPSPILSVSSVIVPTVMSSPEAVTHLDCLLKPSSRLACCVRAPRRSVCCLSTLSVCLSEQPVCLSCLFVPIGMLSPQAVTPSVIVRLGMLSPEAEHPVCRLASCVTTSCLSHLVCEASRVSSRLAVSIGHSSLSVSSVIVLLGMLCTEAITATCISLN